MPIFDPTTSTLLKSFTFEGFIEKVKLFRSTHPTTVPKVILAVAKLYRKDVNKWLKKRTEDLFTWSDVNVSQIIYKNNITHCKPIADFALNVCKFYYRVTNYSIQSESFEQFMSQPIPDHSKPYNWSQLPDYVSYGQVLMALYCENEGTAFPCKLNDQFFAQTNKSLISQFQKTFSDYFPSPLTIDNVGIPYAFYKQCWNDAQSGSSIKPYSIEICFYFVQQNKLSLNFVVDELWTEGAALSQNKYTLVQVIPLMKNFSIYDWKRLELMNAVMLSLGDKNVINAWKKTASQIFSYKIPSSKNGLGWWGISRIELFISHQRGLKHFFTIQKGFEAIYPLIQASMINSYITESLFLWQSQQTNAEYDSLYLEIIYDALLYLYHDARKILRTKTAIEKNIFQSSVFVQNIISQYPLTGVLAILANTSLKASEINQLVPSLTKILTNQQKEKTMFMVQAQPLTQKQLSMLSVKKPVPIQTPKLANTMITSFEKQTSLQDYFGGPEVVYHFNHLTLHLKACSDTLRKKQGLYEYQISQNSSLMDAIQDLSALLVVGSQKIHPHVVVASRILKKDIPQNIKDFIFMNIPPLSKFVHIFLF